jgi:hypothetical protein
MITFFSYVYAFISNMEAVVFFYYTSKRVLSFQKKFVKHDSYLLEKVLRNQIFFF